MKIGMYFYQRIMTSKSTPVVVTIGLGRVTVVSLEQVLLDAPAQYLQVKLGKGTGSLTVTWAQGKLILVGMGSSSSPQFTPAQVAEVQAAQQVAAQDVQTSQLELGQMIWVGKQHQLDGSKLGAIRSVAAGEGRDQRRIGGIVRDAMVAAGVQPA